MQHLPALSLVVPLLAAAILVAAFHKLPRWCADLFAVLVAAGTTAMCCLLLLESTHQTIIYWFGNWPPRHGVALGISFVIDPFGAGLATLVATLVTAALVFSIKYFEAIGAMYHALMLVFMGSMVGFALTGDLFNLFVLFELMSATAYALTAYKIEDEAALEGAINFGITNSVGAFMVLSGIAMLYGRTGALNMAQLGRALAVGPTDGLVITALVLISLGYLVKAAVVPLHFWLADAHAVAPTPVCVLFSGIMVELGVYAVARIYWTVFSGAIGTAPAAVRNVLMALGILTSVVGAIMCYEQRHLKRLLAFSTISHTGIFLTGFGLLSAKGLAGAALYILGHGLVKGALFLCAGILLHRKQSVDELRLFGQGKDLQFTAVVFCLGGFGLASLPPFGTYLGKSLIEEAAEHLGRPEIPAVLIFASIFTGGAVLRAFARIFLGWGDPPEEPAGAPQANGTGGGSGPPGEEKPETGRGGRTTPLVMIGPAGVLVALGLFAGIYHPLSHEVDMAAALFQDRIAYAAAVIDGRAVSPMHLLERHQEIVPGLLSGCGSAAGAVVLALVGLFHRRIPRVLGMPLQRGLGPVLRWLRAVHSGHVGDYITWLVIAVTTIAVYLAATVRGP